MSQSNPADGLHAALALASAGLPVFPCREADKAPATPRGHLDATTDPERIRSWWTRWPRVNVAVRTGEPSGLVVLDVDGEAGADSLRALEREHGELPGTRSVVTPRAGAHYYFRWPGFPVKTTASVLAPSVDVRGDGGYALVPPSYTAVGAYVWDSEAEPAAMPGWLVEKTREPAEGRMAAPPDSWAALTRDIPAGRRNATLAQLTGYLLRRYVAVDLAAVLVQAMNAQHCRPPLPAGEVDAIFDSIARSELRRRESRS